MIATEPSSVQTLDSFLGRLHRVEFDVDLALMDVRPLATTITFNFTYLGFLFNLDEFDPAIFIFTFGLDVVC